MKPSAGPELRPQDLSTILVVDDDPTVLAVLRRVLGRAGKVRTAACANEALATLDEAAAHVVVSDYRMPGMTGIELFDAVRRRFPDTVRVLISANCEVEAAADAINDGLVSRLVLKPWRDEELLAVVRLSLRDRELLTRTRAAAEDLVRLGEKLRFVPGARDAAPLLGLLRALLSEHERRIAWGA
jgi:DNA-binding NtrC family response regulator